MVLVRNFLFSFFKLGLKSFITPSLIITHAIQLLGPDHQFDMHSPSFNRYIETLKEPSTIFNPGVVIVYGGPYFLHLFVPNSVIPTLENILHGDQNISLQFNNL
jgi:hypothetical protein